MVEESSIACTKSLGFIATDFLGNSTKLEFDSKEEFDKEFTKAFWDTCIDKIQILKRAENNVQIHQVVTTE